MVSFECLPLCYLTEPECCISVVHNMQKENKTKFRTCVLELVFCKADQVVTTEESEPLPHMQETEKHDRAVLG